MGLTCMRHGEKETEESCRSIINHVNLCRALWFFFLFLCFCYITLSLFLYLFFARFFFTILSDYFHERSNKNRVHLYFFFRSFVYSIFFYFFFHVRMHERHIITMVRRNKKKSKKMKELIYTYIDIWVSIRDKSNICMV